MIRILFAIDRLNSGGAERQFIELLKAIDKKRFEVWAVVFHRGGTLQPELDGIERVKVICLNRKGILHFPLFFIRLLSVIHRIKPDIIHSYMGGTNELCLILAKMLGSKSVWGIRSSNMNFSHYNWFAGVSFKVGAFLSRITDLMIVNSHAGQVHYTACGYDAGKMKVVANGINTNLFYPDQKTGRTLRETLGISKDTILIGHVGRILPKKDQAVFLKAAALLLKINGDVRFIIAGDGRGDYKNRLRELASGLGIESSITWLGQYGDMNTFYNCLDILTLTSAYGEGFPNVVGEAMSCGVPCVVTDVGDSALIVGGLGIVVKPGDAEAICGGWKTIITLSQQKKKKLRKELRKTVIKKFSTTELARNTEGLLKGML